MTKKNQVGQNNTHFANARNDVEGHHGRRPFSHTGVGQDVSGNLHTSLDQGLRVYVQLLSNGVLSVTCLRVATGQRRDSYAIYQTDMVQEPAE